MVATKATYTFTTPSWRFCMSRQRVTPRSAAGDRYGWDFSGPPKIHSGDVKEIPLEAIKRPLQGTRSNDGDKVQALVESIQEIGQQEPVDVLEVDGTYYGFSGCHRFEAMQRLESPTILAKVRKANKQILKMHFM